MNTSDKRNYASLMRSISCRQHKTEIFLKKKKKQKEKETSIFACQRECEPVLDPYTDNAGSSPSKKRYELGISPCINSTNLEEPGHLKHAEPQLLVTTATLGGVINTTSGWDSNLR